MAVTDQPGSVVGTNSGALLDPTALWRAIRGEQERALLELDRLVATAFDRELSERECGHAHSVCDALQSAYADLGLNAPRDLILQLDGLLRPGSAGPEVARASSSLVEDLRKLLSLSGADAPAPDPENEPLLVVGRSSRLVDGVLWRACMAGLPVAHLEGWAPVEFEPACVIVVDEGSSAADAQRSVRLIAESLSAVSIVFASRRADTETRLAVAPYAATVVSNASPNEVVAHARALTARQRVDRAIAIFAAPGNDLADGLAKEGLHATLFTDVESFIACVGSGAVQTVVIAADLDRAVRLGVPALIRTDPQTRNIGVVSLLERAEPGPAAELMRAGADAVLPANLPIDVLASSCRTRIRRSLELLKPPDIVERTGAVSQDHATLLIDRMLTSAHRERSPVALALLTFEGEFGQQLDFVGFADQIAQEFRRGDVVGCWSDNRFVVALNGVGRKTGARRFDDLLRNLALGASARVGVVEFPHDGRSLSDLLGTAESLVQTARFDNGPRVTTSDSQITEQGPDVLVVDPDVTLRALVVTLLEMRDMTVVQLNDGVAALEYLTGAWKRALPRAVIMELDLMGIDGLQLLRQLNEAGVMNELRILVLTSRIREFELVQALELGVTDIVTKPFSPALLLHRLRRVMA